MRCITTFFWAWVAWVCFRRLWTCCCEKLQTLLCLKYLIQVGWAPGAIGRQNRQWCLAHRPRLNTHHDNVVQALCAGQLVSTEINQSTFSGLGLRGCTKSSAKPNKRNWRNGQLSTRWYESTRTGKVSTECPRPRWMSTGYGICTIPGKAYTIDTLTCCGHVKHSQS